MRQKKREKLGRMCVGAGGREQDVDVIDEAFTGSPGSSFLPTLQKPELLPLTQQNPVPADL